MQRVHVSVDEVAEFITGNKELHSVDIRYRNSGPFKGDRYVKPYVLDRDIRADKYHRYIDRQPRGKQEALRHQMQIDYTSTPCTNT